MSSPENHMVPVVIDERLRDHPLAAFHQAISGFPLIAAPEHAERQAREWDGITIEVSWSPGGRNACACGQRVVIESGFLDALWCFAASHYLLRLVYDENVSQKDLTQEHLELDPSQDTRVHDSQTWLFMGLSKEPLDWSTAPRLTPEAEHGTCQLASFAAAFILCHELGHIRLQHSKLPDNPSLEDYQTSREQEQDADGYALSGFLGQHLDDTTTAFRAWGILVAAYALCQREHARSSSVEAQVLSPRKQAERTHPFAYLRLDRILKQTAVADSDIVLHTLQSAAAVSIYVHGVHTGLSAGLESQRFRDWGDLYETLIDRMAEIVHEVHE